MWDCLWELGAVGASSGQGGEVHSSQPQQGLPVLPLHPVLNGLTRSWNTAFWKLIWFAFSRAPQVRDQGEAWLSILEETVLPQG